MVSDNLKLWDKYKDTDMDYTKPYDLDGEELTSIKAMYQVYRATKEWGSMGKIWGVKDSNFKTIEIGRIESGGSNATILLICEYTATLFYPDGLISITSSKQMTFKGSFDSDYSKKCATEALSWGLARLGFSSDIYMQKYKPVKLAVGQEAEEGLTSYKEKNPDIKESEIINSKPIHIESESDTSTTEEIENQEPVLSELDQALTLKAKSKRYSQKRIDSILSNDQIGDIMKKSFISGKIKDLP